MGENKDHAGESADKTQGRHEELEKQKQNPKIMKYIRLKGFFKKE